VLAAVGIDYRIEHVGHRWHLLVDKAVQAEAHTELETFWEENAKPSEAPVAPTVVDNGWFGVLGYLGIIWLLPSLDAVTTTDFLEAGRLDAVAFRNGEWWRIFTALTLHGDIAHIAANSLFGTVFGLFVGRYLGSGVGWLLVLLCGAAANLTNALVQPGAFRSIGASTATFAALGLAPAFAWRRGYFRGRGWKRGFAPVFAAIALLAYTGMGGGDTNIDVLGHVFGFAAGLITGLTLANIDLARMSLADQQRAGGFAASIVLVAWLTALS
jgi:membrane associated rhomboid family serine protease